MADRTRFPHVSPSLIGPIAPTPPTLPPLLRALRPHQWSKNLLVLLPALAAHRLSEVDVFVAVVAATASMSALASATYLMNDLTDIEVDRLHPTKRHRPLAAGTLSKGTAMVAALVLVLGSLALAWTLPRLFLAVWGAYLVTTTAYSMGLKRLLALDVLVLSALYTVRVVAGAAAAEVPLSRWFLAFSVFLFLSLALLKRAIESWGAQARALEALDGRGWRVDDLPILVSLGLGSGVAAALVYCLYITGDDVIRLYSRPDVLWLGLPVILYWLARAWVLAHRGETSDDPVAFALRDRASWICLAVFGAAVWLAT